MQCAVKRVTPTVTISCIRNAHATTYNCKCRGDFGVQDCLGAEPETEDYGHYEDYGYGGLEVFVFPEFS